MRKLFILFLLTFIVITPSITSAQEKPSLAVVEVDLWPEFDHLSILVIYQITLPPDVQLPADIEIRIPADSIIPSNDAENSNQIQGEPNALAARQPNGSLFNLPYTKESEGDWSRIVFKATTPEIQLEYYDPNIEMDNNSRHFHYRWPGDYEVEDFIIEVQQPFDASDMRITPTLGSGVTKADGMVYFSSDIGSLPDGQSFEISLNYEKESDTLSAENVPLEASGPINVTASSRIARSNWLPWLLGIGGLLLIFGGVIWYWQSGRETSGVKKETPRRRKSSVQKEIDTISEGDHIYCHQCGKRATHGDRFCRACGTQLRIS